MITKNSLCICKHPEKVHHLIKDVKGIWGKDRVFCLSEIKGQLCECTQFKLDTLKYLEQQYEKKHS